MDWLSKITPYTSNALTALITAVIGIIVIVLLRKTIKRFLALSKIDTVAMSFIINLVTGLLSIVLLIIVLGKLGVPTASLLTVLGAGSLAIALALKDSLSNVAAGLLILLIKPFRKGDTIEIAGSAGSVDEINLFTTQIKAPNNEIYYFPNAKVLNDKIINRTRFRTRRHDITIGIAYESDLAKVKSILTNLLNAEPLILNTPNPTIGVNDFADSAINILVRFWVKKEHFVDARFAFLEAVKTTFDQENITIPFPQREVTLKKESSPFNEGGQ